MNRKSISIFGSTGSIGRNTIQIIKKYPELFEVILLTANSNVKELIAQALALHPKYVYIEDKNKILELKQGLKSLNIEVLGGSIAEVAQIKVDLMVMAIMGYNAMLPTISAIEVGNNIALANKECLVCAGSLIAQLALKHKVKIIPVDSEHSGLFQIFDNDRPSLIKHVTLTASGGPFRNYTIEQMKDITKLQALKHPNWVMGAKITIDSATLVNKCLEVIEAYYLFPLQAEQIKIIIHPESIIHAIINFCDGSMLAQLSIPNMQIPISYALFYPDRAVLPEFNSFDLSKVASLNFVEPDRLKFRSLALLKAVLKSIDTNSSLVFNIANEVAVEAFLNDQISFLQITQVIENMLMSIEMAKITSIEETIETIDLIKEMTLNYIKNISQ